MSRLVVAAVLLVSTAADTRDQFLTGPASWPSVAKVEHYSSGVGMYGYEVHNYDGANMAIVVHQYSGFAPAMQIDNTKNQPAIVLRNTENPDTSPGTRGTGAFVLFAGYGKTDPKTSTTLGWIGPDLDFHSSDPKVPFKFFNGLSLAGDIKINDRPAVSCKGLNPATIEVVNGLIVNC